MNAAPDVLGSGVGPRDHKDMPLHGTGKSKIPRSSFQEVGLERHCWQPQTSSGEFGGFFIPTILRSSFSSSSIIVIVVLFNLFLLVLAVDLAKGLRTIRRRFSGTLLEQIKLLSSERTLWSRCRNPKLRGNRCYIDLEIWAQCKKKNFLLW